MIKLPGEGQSSILPAPPLALLEPATPERVWRALKEKDRWVKLAAISALL